MNYFNTPIYLISFNRVSYLRQLVEWLERAGYSNIHIVDNNSTYPPLLDYLATCPHHVHRLEKNYGHLALWESGKFDDVINNQNFVLSDCDVVPAEACPANVVEQLANVLNRYPRITKVGLSLRIDDIPDHYAFKPKVLEWEASFWARELENGLLYDASVDTTFAYYRPGIPPTTKRWWRSLRTAPPLTARHLPWYSDSNAPSDEDRYYQECLKERSSAWSITDPVLLKEQNLQLHAEIRLLQEELAIVRKGPVHYLLHWMRKKLVRLLDLMRLGEPLRRLRRYIQEGL